MRREEKRRKLHESLLNNLYPPPPPPLTQQDENPATSFKEEFDVNLIPDDYGLRATSSSSSSDDDGGGGGGGECGTQKLTRAQRKRLRKKKLKEDASRRREIIGPLLPPTSRDGDGNCGGDVDKDSPGVRQNSHENHCNESNKEGEVTAGCSQSKLKQRRKAKKLARERLKSPSAGDLCSRSKKFRIPERRH